MPQPVCKNEGQETEGGSLSPFQSLSPTLSPSQGPADAGPFLYEKTQEKTRELEAIDSKKRHNRQRIKGDNCIKRHQPKGTSRKYETTPRGIEL